jgi:O-antigen ligase
MTTLLGGLVVIAAIEAGYGTLNLVSGNETIILSKRVDYLNAATGTLISKNHFAYLMEMMLPVAAGCVASLRVAMASDKRRSDQRGPQSIVIGVVTALIATALLLSASRMGIASMALSTLIIMLITPRLPGAPKVRKRLRWTFASGAALACVYTLAIGVEGTFARAGLIWTDFVDGRLPIWRATWNMFADRPLFGHGWGTFVDIHASYKPAPTGLYSPHAHNEYLQVAGESGIIGLAIVLLLVGSFLYGLRGKLTAPGNEADQPIRVGLAIAILSVFIHSVTDFGLRIPGVGLTFAYVLALYCSTAPIVTVDGAAPRTTLVRHRRSRDER